MKLLIIFLISFSVNAQSLIGSGANQVPTNGMLGSMAFEDNKNYPKRSEFGVMAFLSDADFLRKGALAGGTGAMCFTGWINCSGSMGGKVTDGIFFAWGGMEFTDAQAGGQGNDPAYLAIPGGFVVDFSGILVPWIVDTPVGKGVFYDASTGINYDLVIFASANESNVLSFHLVKADSTYSQLTPLRKAVPVATANGDKIFYQFTVPVKRP